MAERPTARRCEKCGKKSPAAISYYRLVPVGMWLCFRCAMQQQKKKVTR